MKTRSASKTESQHNNKRGHVTCQAASRCMNLLMIPVWRPRQVVFARRLFGYARTFTKIRFAPD
ncbi:hypothetical protein DBV39_12810 [Orrella marina]|uniref:Uncharacterized protein n=1 Tax=Orrella marina TaxID=2163011 RepID=A0A2R4XKZ0_9BURK|nr:hypothetical protein DBV39_12810 [Orrella marina]